ncbi:hypothetical protein AC579_3543 [Pseudocercospora musae]|uniref:FAD-binding domain-containing protein n=1 Tax=Pseudocercospora musae TaxID=113226 RepID=A0A139IVX1_9PEZI|nr:hypothetical protein AC579_3543 [Pseudocercospora musae]
MSLPGGIQFHSNGYRGSGDPKLLQFSGEEPDFQRLPPEVDVLIVGAGPAGHLLGAQLAQFPDITTRMVEARLGRLEWGQADGLQCRTIEIFEAFGFSERVLKEAYWVNETTFWAPSEDGSGLIRRGRIRDTEEGLSEFPHVILNQARMQDLWLDAMKWSPTRLEPSYGTKLVELKRPTGDERVDVTLERTDEAHKGRRESVRAKYVVGCDGARSLVRQSLGLEMRGDWANQAWGVMDALLVTDFPDLRLKTVIHSANDGSIQIIPREGGYLARFYIELDKVSPDSRVEYRKNVTAEMLVERAKRIFRPYTFDVREIAYWSVYEVGQRLTDHFDNIAAEDKSSRCPRIFIAGDACHTHSAKAGQGMNVSMNDTFNLGWKLMHVLRNRSPPELLHTYSEERQSIAQQLIDFDREIARIFAAKPKKGAKHDEEGVVDPEVFQEYFTRQGRFMAGLETEYKEGTLISAESKKCQNLAKGYKIGTRFQSDQVLRVADAKPVHLGHVMDADGRWRIVLFGDNKHDATSKESSLAKMCEFLEHALIPMFTPEGQDVDSVFDVRAVLQQSRQKFGINELPTLLLPRKGKLGIRDYEKAFTDEESYGWGNGAIFKTREIDREKGCVVVVRPDQYISAVVPLSSEANQLLMKFFGGFMNEAGRVTNGSSD